MSRTRKPQPRNFNSPQKCGGKYCYGRKEEAEAVVEEKTIIDPELQLQIYYCATCHSWHLTSVKPSTSTEAISYN